MTKIIIVSGGFDPVHVGHIRMFKDAANMADKDARVNQGKVIVALNSDEWLERKKGKAFMPFEERKEILKSIQYVSNVIAFDDSDETACDAIKQMYEKYEYLTESNFNDDALCFANGGDRVVGSVPSAESTLCKELGIKMLWDIGGVKVQSSSQLIEKFEARELVPITVVDDDDVIGGEDESTADSDN